MLTMVNPTDFGGHSSKVKVMMGFIAKCEVRGDATLCVVLFINTNVLVYNTDHDYPNKKNEGLNRGLHRVKIMRFLNDLSPIKFACK